MRGVLAINVEISRKEISAKFDVYCPTIEKYLLKGIDKWIGDCKGKKKERFCGQHVINELIKLHLLILEPKVFHNFWMTANDIIALPMVNMLVGEVWNYYYHR